MKKTKINSGLALQEFEWKNSRHLWQRYSDLQVASPPEAVPTPADIPGADLEEPFQAHTVSASLWLYILL